MTPTKEEIKAWVDSPERGREWLAQQCSTPEKTTAVGTVNNWLTVKKVKIPSRAMLVIQRLMQESSKKDGPSLPERINIEPSEDEFKAWCLAFKASEAGDLKQWMIESLNRAANQARFTVVEQALPKKQTAHIQAAAGSPIYAEVMDWEGENDTVQVRINGLSMVPTLNDGDVVEMRHKKMSRSPYMKKGLIYLVAYDGGYTVKRYNTRKATADEMGEEWVEDGKVKVLESINPEFPEIVIKQPLEWVAWLDSKLS